MIEKKAKKCQDMKYSFHKEYSSHFSLPEREREKTVQQKTDRAKAKKLKDEKREKKKEMGKDRVCVREGGGGGTRGGRAKET